MIVHEQTAHVAVVKPLIALAAILALQHEGRADEAYLLNPQQQAVRYVDDRGMATTIEYNAAGLPFEIRSPGGMSRFGYDPDNRHAWTEDDVGLVSYDYDAADRLVAIRYRVERHGRTVFRQAVRYGYDDHGQVQSLTLGADDGDSRYRVELARDIKGRLVLASFDSHTVRFEHASAADGEALTRRLPDGTVSRFEFNPVGLTQSISHRLPAGDDQTLTSTIDYEFGDGRVQVSVSDGDETQTRLVSLQNDAHIDLAPQAKLYANGDGRLVEQRIGRQLRWFLSAPTGQATGLVIEIDRSGYPAAAYFAAPFLSVEHRFGDAPTYVLEDGVIAASAPLDIRLASGRSVAETAGKAGQAVTLPKVLEKTAPLVDYGVKAADLLNKLTVLRHNHFQPNADPGKLNWNLHRLKLLAAGLADASDFANSQASLREKLYQHGLLGKTVEYLAKKSTQELFARRIGKGLGSEIVGLGFDLLRHRGLLSPDATEHMLDMAFAGTAGVTATMIMAPLGLGHLVPGIVDIATKVPDIPRKLLKDDIIAMAVLEARTGDDRTGEFIYQAASSLLRGNLDYFNSVHGDIFSTVVHGDRPHRSAHLARRKRAYREFQAAVGSGSRRAVAELLEEDRHVRRALKLAGYSATRVSQMVTALRAESGPKPLPGAAIGTTAPTLGGVDLSGLAPVAVNVGSLRGVVTDPDTGTVIVLGDGDLRSDPLDVRLLATALAAELSQPSQDLQFSLDPIAPEDPDSWQKAVYMPESLLRGNPAGQTMYAGDLDLKLIAFGAEIAYGPWQDISREGSRVSVPVEVWTSNRFRPLLLAPRSPLWPGFRSVPELRAGAADGGKSVRSRQWIVVENATIEEQAGAAIVADVKLGVRARQQAISSDGKLVDIDSDDPVSTAFAEQLTAGFDRAAERIASFRALEELARTVAIAKWLVASDVPLDREWIVRNAGHDRDGAREISTLHWSHSRTTQTVDKQRRAIRTSSSAVRISGGVDLTFEPARRTSGRAAAMRDATLAANAVSDDPVFDVSLADETLTAVVVPLNASGGARWSGYRMAEQASSKYLLNEAGQAMAGIDSFGTVERYAWREDGALAAVTSSTANGKHVERQFGDDNGMQRYSNASGQRYEVSGRNRAQATLRLEGNVAMTLARTVRGNEVLLSVRYPGQSIQRVLVADLDGRVQEIRRSTPWSGDESLRIDAAVPGWDLQADAWAAGNSGTATVSAREAGELVHVTASLFGLVVRTEFDAAGVPAGFSRGERQSRSLGFDPAAGRQDGRIGGRYYEVRGLGNGYSSIVVRSTGDE